MEKYIIIGILILLILYSFLTYNKLVNLNNKVKEAFATMDVYLKKRWDLIPNLINTVKGYAKHEKDTLEEVVTLRNTPYDTLSDDEKITTNNQMTNQITKMMALAENYPELKANENFIDLSTQLTKVEDEIANARKYFNGTVREFNNKVEMFPSNIIAKLLGYHPKNMFQIKEDEKQNVKVKW